MNTKTLKVWKTLRVFFVAVKLQVARHSPYCETREHHAVSRMCSTKKTFTRVSNETPCTRARCANWLAT